MTDDSSGPLNSDGCHPIRAVGGVNDGTQIFTYHRAIAPMMWVLVTLATIELVVVHFLLAIWSPAMAITVSLATLGGVGWLIWTVLSFSRLPVLVKDDHVTLRVGVLRSVAVLRSAIVGVRLDGWTGEEIKARSTLNLALIAWPNLVVDLREPLPGRRQVTAIAHRLDDPAGFAAELKRLRRWND